MKLSRKLLKFTKPLTYRRGWRRAQRSFFRISLQPMLAKIDEARAREIQRRYANSNAGYAKYANIEPWLRLNRERVQDLKLHRSEPKRVLDLGCGGGFFLFIAKNLGHSVLGLDITRRSFYRIARAFRRPARNLENQRIRTVAQSWPKIRLDHRVFDQLLSLSSVKGTLGNSRMGFFPGRFTTTPRPGWQDFLRA